MSNQEKAFENNSFKVFVEEKPGCQVLLKIKVSKDQVIKTHKQAIKKINKEVSVPGFRKGKAPDATVLKNFATYVEQEWKEILVNDALRGSLDLTKIYPLNKDSIQRPKIESCSLEDGASVVINFERYPEIPVVDFSQLNVPSIEAKPVNDEKIHEVLEEIQKAHANWEDVSGRPVADGDFIDLDIDAIDQDPVKSIVKDRRFEVSEKKMISWLRNLVLGMEIGAVKEGTSELDDNADEQVKAKFKPTHCRIQLNGIKKIIPHEINDELAKKAGASSVIDLKQKITQNLQDEAAFEQKAKQYELLEDTLLSTYPFEIPASMFEGERQWRIKEKIRELKNQNISDDEIKNRESEIESEVAKETHESLRLYFLGKQIAEQGKIQVTNQELNQELIRHMSQNPGFYGKENNKEASQEVISHLANNLMQRKAKEYALAQINR